MDDDDDVAAAAIFEGLARAFLQIDRKPGLLQHGSAGHTRLQLFDVLLFHVCLPALYRPFPV